MTDHPHESAHPDDHGTADRSLDAGEGGDGEPAQISEFRRQLDERGLQVLGVTSLSNQSGACIVYLHGNSGQWIDDYALSLIRSLPNVAEVRASPTAPTIIRVRLQAPNGRTALGAGESRPSEEPLEQARPQRSGQAAADASDAAASADGLAATAEGPEPDPGALPPSSSGEEPDIPDPDQEGVLAGLPAEDSMRRLFRPAESADRRPAAQLAANAWLHLPLAAGLVPDFTARRGRLIRVFIVLIKHALQHGHVDVVTAAPGTPAHTRLSTRLARLKNASGTNPAGNGTGWELHGLAAWTPWPLPAIPSNQLIRAAGADADAFVTYLSESTVHHPSDPAHHRQHQLSLLAVHPDHQGTGIADLLLRVHTHRLNRYNLGGYVECTDNLQGFFERHGFRPHPSVEPFGVPGGITLTPMHRWPGPCEVEERVIDLRGN